LKCCSLGLAAVVTIIVVAGLGSSFSRAATQGGLETESLHLPVVPACVSSPFGPRVLANQPLAGTFHNGIDLRAPVGSPVSAVAPGKIIRVHRHGVGGLEILIQHSGFIGVYSHLGLIAPVLAEDAKTVYAGERIGSVGRSGLSYGPHVYFGMIVDGRTVDPAPYLKVGSCGAGVAGTTNILALSARSDTPSIKDPAVRQ
jgi:murein DD-endopeptidase MepM/ murein hydrolase activator NlpD